MKNLAAKIYRQRLVIEGIYSIDVTPKKIKTYMRKLSDDIGMTIIYGPMVKNLAGRINPIHKGLEAFLIWAESGTQVYTWENEKFFTVDIYSCKEFDVDTAVKFTKEYFGCKDDEIVHKSV
ncbi:hypothetical protein FJZ53_06160 [Candidatus Woesearchaeota archaeon]|nr:hypothetical protein [Candidatus Woesearchaeota archaeon]